MNYHMNDTMNRERSNEMKLQRTNKGQWIITIPSTIADAMRMKVGDKLLWEIEEDGLHLRRNEK